jgi:acetoin utilization protein AcuB
MSRQPITLWPGATVRDAVEVFNKHRISGIPIVDQDFKPVGIISWRDIMKHLYK